MTSAVQTSVIIPTYNGRELTLECLRSLQAQELTAWETIVVDNGSTDGTADAIRQEFPHVRLVELPKNLGYGMANTLGTQHARGHILVFLNNDTVLAPGCLEHLTNQLAADPCTGACSAKPRLLSNRGTLDTIGSSLTWTGFLHHIGFLEADLGQYDRVQSVFSPKGVCYAIPKHVFVAVGGFDERYFAYFEETDLFWRIWLSGFAIRFVPNAVIYHAVGKTSERFHSAFIEYHAYRNRIRTLLKNLGWRRAVVVIPIHIACCMIISVGYALKGRVRNAVAVLRALAWNAVSLSDTWKARRHVQRDIRRISDTVLFKEFWVNPTWNDCYLGFRLIFARQRLWEEYRRTAQVPSR